MSFPRMQQYTLSQQEKAAIKEIWVQLLIHKQAWGIRFYERLFELYPYMKPLFSKVRIEEQGLRLGNILTFIVAKLDKLEQVRQEVKALAQRHIAYQVKAEYYLPFIKLLLEVLREGMAERWTPLMEQAMRKVMLIMMEAITEQLATPDEYEDIMQKARQALER